MAKREEVVIRIRVQDGVTRALRVIQQGLQETGVSGAKSAKGLGKTAAKAAVIAKMAGPIGLAVKAVTALGAAAVTTSAAFTALAIRDFARFEQSIVDAAAVTKEGTANIAAFGEAAKIAGMSSAFSAREAGGALQFMSMAGMKAKESIRALPDVLALASAGSLDLASAADIATNIMTGYGKGASDLSHVNDVLTGTFTKTNVSLRELGHAFKMAGPVAKASGQDFEQMSAVIGMLGNAGIKGTMAGRTLRTALIQLQAPSSKARAALKELGVEVFDSNGKMRDFASILGDIQKAGAGTQALADIFGREAIAGIQALLEQGPEELDKLTSKLRRVHGITKDIEATKLDTVAGQFQVMSGALETLSGNFGEQLGPIVKGVIRDFNDLLASGQFLKGSLGELTDFAKENGDTLRAWGRGGIQFAAQLLDEMTVVMIKLAKGTVWLMEGFETVMKGLGLFVDTGDRARDTAQNLKNAIMLLHASVGLLVYVFNPVAGILVTFSSLLWGMGDGAEHAAQAMDKVAQTRFLVDMVRYAKNMESFATGIKSIDGAVSDLSKSFKGLKKDADVVLEFAGLVGTAYKDALTGAVEEQKKITKEQSRAQKIAWLQVKQVNASNDISRARLGIQIASLEVLERGLEGAEAALVKARARKRLESAIAADEQKRAAAAKKRRKEEEKLVKALEKTAAIQAKTMLDGFKDRADKAHEAEEAARLEAQEQRRAGASLEIRKEVIATRRSEMTLAEGLLRLQEEGLEGKKLELAQFDLEEAHKLRLLDIERERLSVMSDQIRSMGESARAIATMEGPVGALGGAFAGVSQIAGDLVENMDEIEGKTNKGIKAVAGAVSAAGGVVASFADKMGASAAAQAGILALFEAAASAASYALGDIPGAVNHGIAAGLYGAAALAGGGSAPSASAGGGAGGAGGSSSASGTSPQSIDFESISRRNAEIQAEALAAALGGQNQNATIILDLSGMVAPDQRTFDSMITGALQRGSRAAGLNSQSLSVVRS